MVALFLTGYRHMPGMLEPVFVGLADLQNLPHIWNIFRIVTHTPKISGSNPQKGTLSTSRC